MYGFTVALCIFTVFILLSGGEKSGTDKIGGIQEAGTDAGAGTDRSAGVISGAGTDRSAGVTSGAGTDRSVGVISGAGTDRSVGVIDSAGTDAGVGMKTGIESDANIDTGTDAGIGVRGGVKADGVFGAVPGRESGSETDAGEGGESGDGKPEITLVMVGDILLHTPVAESGKQEDGSYDFSAVFAEMKEEIASADLALVNQEVILGGEELGISGYPAFNAPYELGDALVDAGFDVVLHATNHALDKGKRGIVNCLAFWQEEYPDVAVLGIHESEAAQEEIYVYEQEGIRLAVLNYTYGTNGIALPQDMPYAVELLDRAKVAEDLRRAQELADFVIVCPHWGTEYVLKETAEQEEWAAFFARNGADLVLGTHPHVIEPVDWVKTEEEGGDGRGTLVYYSLGNFVNWTSGTGTGVANRMVGAMAQVTVGLDEEGEAVITSYGVEPLVCHVEQGFGGVTVYPLDAYTEELAERNEIVGQDSEFSLSYCRKLAEEVLGSLWLP